MRLPVNKNDLLSKLLKVQKQKQAVMAKLSLLHGEELELTKQLKEVEAKSFRHGDRVYIENDILHPPSPDGSDRRATVRYTRKTASDQTLVVLTTDNGYKTHRVPRNIRKMR